MTIVSPIPQKSMFFFTLPIFSRKKNPDELKKKIIEAIGTTIPEYSVMVKDLKNDFSKTFEEIKVNCKSEINELYKTKCKKCGNTAITLATIWDREKAEPLELRYYCGNCKQRNAKKPDEDDLKLIKKIEKMDIPIDLKIILFIKRNYNPDFEEIHDQEILQRIFAIYFNNPHFHNLNITNTTCVNKINNHCLQQLQTKTQPWMILNALLYDKSSFKNLNEKTMKNAMKWL